MRKNLVLAFLSFVGIFWCIYRSKDLDVKGLKRVLLAIKIAAIIIVSIFGMPRQGWADGTSVLGTDAYRAPAPISRVQNNIFPSGKSCNFMYLVLVRYWI